MDAFNAVPDRMDARIHVRWGLKIPLRDGTRLNANLYMPRDLLTTAPAIFTLTPYMGQTYHDQGVYFASNGYPFLTVDVRGRGNSEGRFQPFINEGRDGFDVVEWLAKEPYCNGKVAMWGGSYAGLNQWTTSAGTPPHLASIVPAAAVSIGTDFPMRGNIFWPYVMQWLTLTSGLASQEKVFDDHRFWSQLFQQWFESGVPFRELDGFVGQPSKIFQEWVDHPQQDTYWDRYSPSADQYARISIPVLTITGIYDNAQRGALMHYQRHLKAAPQSHARHYVVIGPWDHAGTRKPVAEFGGLRFGPESLVDLQRLHLEWYAWSMQEGPRPEFLKKRVAYYVTGIERWRYVDALEEITVESRPLYLTSTGGVSHIFRSGALSKEPRSGDADVYVYDPRDISNARIERELSDPLCLRPAFPTNTLTDQRHVYTKEGRQLIYHSAPFETDAEVSGFFALILWLSIDQPDTDICVAVYDIDRNGASVLLTSDSIRARYRKGLREERLIRTKAPLRYDFAGFNFVSRQVRKGNRLRLVVGPVDSIYSQKNYNSGGIVSDESREDARTVIVSLFHDQTYRSVLYVPLGQSED